MQNYLTPEEMANMLKVDVSEILELIEQGKLKALRIGNKLRIRETDLETLEVTTDRVSAHTNGLPQSSVASKGTLPNGVRWSLTRTGRAKFRVSGSIATGAEIWPGRMQYPIKFSKEFMDALLAHFHGAEVPVGGKFDDPDRGSLGEFIQQKLKIKMNPAVYLAALLIDEGYAENARRGYIRFRFQTSHSLG